MGRAGYRRAILILLIGGAGAVSPPSGLAQDTPTVQDVIASGRVPWARWPDFAPHIDEVRRLYASGAGALVWFDGPFVSRAAMTAVAVLLHAGEHGLDPRDYDAEALDRLARHSIRAPLAATEGVRFDLLLSVNLIRFLSDLRLGRLNPRFFDRLGTRALGLDLAAAITQAVQADSLGRLVEAATSPLAQYRNLQRLLGRYRILAADSSLVPPGGTPPLSPELPYEGVSALRRLLAATGDLPADQSWIEDERYTAGDADAVRRFQGRHALPADGALNAATLAELSVPFRRRARQIELALERLRWLPPLRGQPMLVVNIPAFQLFAFDSSGGSGVPSLAMKVIVGQALDTRTPVMLEHLRYVEFRPYWNVPRSILMNEIVPMIRRNSRYLEENDMEVVGPGDRVLGSGVSPEILEQLTRGDLRVRQRPGPGNALGLTKFVFPNSAAVYLHGTPRPELFGHTRRDFSHGCIRLEDPTALAAWVLRDQPGWARQAIIAAQNRRETTRAWLTRPIPVVVFYTTAAAAPDGSARFYPDIYGHDRALEEALMVARADE